MRLSDLQTKKIVDINDGKAMGNIIDVNLQDNGSIESLVIEQSKNFFALNKESDVKVYWSDIEKIGEDVILVRKAN